MTDVWSGDYPPCDECGRPFTEAEWTDRHGDYVDVHADCCTVCNLPDDEPAESDR